MSRFRFLPTSLDGLRCIERLRMGDDRGFLARLFCADEFEQAGAPFSIVQINHTLTRACGTVRGLHFQFPPHAETKLVSCIRGQIFDVAVDLRAGSPTFLKWHGEVLSPDNGRALYIPPGFAHGFQTLTDDCELVYLHSSSYHPESEGAANLADPRIGIAWPLPVGTVSDRDRNHPFLAPEFPGIQL